jgi:hypothetical protein
MDEQRTANSSIEESDRLGERAVGGVAGGAGQKHPGQGEVLELAQVARLVVR